MEGEHRYGDVEPQETQVGKEPGQVDEPESEDESREKPLTGSYGQPCQPDRAEKVPEPPAWFLRETAEEPGAATPEAAEENAGEEVTEPPSRPVVNRATAVVDPTGLSLVDEPPAPEAASEAVSRDGEGEVESPVIEPVREAVAVMKAEAELEESKPFVKSVKRKKGRQKKTAHKRTDKAHKKPAKRKSRKPSAKRPAKKPKKSRA